MNAIHGASVTCAVALVAPIMIACEAPTVGDRDRRLIRNIRRLLTKGFP